MGGVADEPPSDILSNPISPITNYLKKSNQTNYKRPMRRQSARGRRRSKTRTRTKKKDPLFVDGKRPRPMYVDYKDVELLKKLVNRHGRIVGRRKTGCTAVSQHAVTQAIKRARFMALLPYTSD